LKHSAQDQLGVLRRHREESFGIGFVRGDRLLHHHMQTRLQCRNPQLRMLVVGRRYQHGVDRSGGYEFQGIAVDGNSLAAVGLQLVGGGRTNRCQTAFGNLSFQQVGGVVTPNVAHANEAKTD
jgi:hypothetical protein